MKSPKNFVLLFLLQIAHGISSAKRFVVFHTDRTSSPELLPNQNISFSYFIKNVGDIPDNDLINLHFFSETPNIISIPNPNITVNEPTRNQQVNFSINIRALYSGHTVVNVSTLNPDVDLRLARIEVKVMRSEALNILSDVIGWGYFIAWSISFYPQVYENWRRKSVIGLNFDFLFMNILGFTLYSFFNIGMLWITSIQEEYFLQHPDGVNPVKLNDVIFSIHAVFLCLVTIYQCYIYERGNQTISKPCRAILIGILLIIITCAVLSLSTVISWLEYLYICSYCKLGISLIKYIPQAYMNYQRKSTLGWSIGNVLLDFTGGFLSIGQMIIDAYNFNDWGSIVGDPTKMGLGLFSILFDLVFIVQHYVLYRNKWSQDDRERIIDNDEDDPHDD